MNHTIPVLVINKKRPPIAERIENVSLSDGNGATIQVITDNVHQDVEQQFKKLGRNFDGKHIHF